MLVQRYLKMFLAETGSHLYIHLRSAGVGSLCQTHGLVTLQQGYHRWRCQHQNRDTT
jgi:hypothetical protein